MFFVEWMFILYVQKRDQPLMVGFNANNKVAVVQNEEDFVPHQTHVAGIFAVCPMITQTLTRQKA